MTDFRRLLTDDVGKMTFIDMINEINSVGAMSLHVTMDDGNGVPLAAMVVVRGKDATAHIIQAIQEAQDLDDPENDPGQEG